MFKLIYCLRPEALSVWNSSVSIVTGYGLVVRVSITGKIHLLQIRFGAHLASNPFRIKGSLPWGKAAGS